MSTASDAPLVQDPPPNRRGLQDAHTKAPLQPAKTPVGLGAITYVGLLLALGVILLGVVGLQAGAAAAGLMRTRPWLTRAVEGVQGLRPLGWAPLVAVVLLIVGLWLLVIALRPRPKTGVPLDARTGVFLRPKDIASLAQDAADDIDGVTSADASASRGKVRVHVKSTSGTAVADAVQQAVTQRLAPLRNQVRVVVRATQVSL